MELKIAQIQMPVTADREENIRCACDMVRQAGDIDMAVLPEMFCCPYDNACFRPYGEAEGGPAYRALSALARERGIWLVGGTLPELAEDVAGPGPAGECLRACRRCFLASGGESWAESWETVLREADLPFSDEDRGLLAEFGQVLGRYDGESQQRALQALLDRLGEQVETARQTARRLVRVDVTLGVTAGLFCLILL